MLRQGETIYIATGGGDDVIHVISFDSLTQETTIVAQQLHAHSQDVNCVRWRPSIVCTSDCIGILASAGDDGVVTLWNVVPEMP
jgi:WD40 repeat protein